jgi:hypothetical protein
LALRWLVATGKLVLDHSAGDWRSGQPVFERLSDRYTDLNLAGMPSETDAQTSLVQAYIATFGPVTEADISFWAGLGKSETARATNNLAGETVLTMVEGIPGMLLLLKAQVEALRSVEPPGQPVVSVLPANDPFTTAHWASRARYIAHQKLQRQVFGSGGAAKPTILVNGQVVGIWAWQRQDDRYRVQWQLLAPVEPTVMPFIVAEVERVAAFIDPQAEIVQIER